MQARCFGESQGLGTPKHGNTGASEVPIISMDYAFMGDKDIEADEAEAVDAEAHYDRNESDANKVKILVAHGAAWRCLVLLGAAWHCLALLGAAWRCLVLLGGARWCWWFLVVLGSA